MGFDRTFFVMLPRMAIILTMVASAMKYVGLLDVIPWGVVVSPLWITFGIMFLVGFISKLLGRTLPYE